MHKSLKDLKFATGGMIKKWKDLTFEGKDAHAKWSDTTWAVYPTDSDFEAGRQQMKYILDKFGLDK